MTKRRKVLYGVVGIVFLAAIGGAAGCQAGKSSTEPTVGLLGTNAVSSTASTTLASPASSTSTTTTVASTTTTRQVTTTTAAVPTTQAPTTTSKVTTTTAPQSGGGDTVYITDHGEKYDRGDCRYLDKSRQAISLADAKARGYEPCKVCKPPE